MSFRSLFIAFILLLASMKTWAWGQRGHHTICDAAVFLVQEEGLRTYLQNKPAMMGHLCNIPDIHWKNFDQTVRPIGDPAHYVDAEVIGLPPQEIPTQYSEIIAKYTNADNKFEPGKKILSVPREFGSSWWRADQFYRRAIAIKDDLEKSTPPSNSKEEQDNSLPFNKLIYDFTVNIGLIGHFVGDNAQPFHTTADHDGYKAGHGGIHSYYEEAVVANLPYDLHAKIVKEGKKMQAKARGKNPSSDVRFLTEKTVIERMRALGAISNGEVEKVYKLDPVLKSSEYKEERGMKIKTPAQRKPASAVAKAYEPLVVAQMARAASLLAKTWDDAYVTIGRPKLATYKSYLFPFTPDFVMPDYYDVNKEKLK